jgi:cell division septum initiation protein DivIVA
MENLKIPLSDTEEAVYQLLQQVNQLKDENQELRETIKRLKWSLTEHD